MRVGPLSATIAVHIGIIAALLMSTGDKPRTPVARALAVFDISASAEVTNVAPPDLVQPEPVMPEPPQPIIVPPPIIRLPTTDQVLVATLSENDAAAPGSACDLTEPVQAALRASEAVTARLPEIPPERRSVANVIMIWNTSWVAVHETLDPEAMATIRETMAGVIAEASLDCRLQQQSGPRMIMIPGATDTTVLALGSGTWRWQDVLDTAVSEADRATSFTTADQKPVLTDADRASFQDR